MSKNRVGKEIRRIIKGSTPNLKMYERYKKRVSKIIKRYQNEKDRLIAESKALKKSDSDEYRAYINGIALMDAMIKDLNNLLGYDIKSFYMKIYRSPHLV